MSARLFHDNAGAYAALMFGLGCRKREKMMRILLALAFATLTVTCASGALADEVEDAHHQALQGRDSYWNCLAREYSPDHIKSMSAQDFTAAIAAACPSERQNFRVTLMDYLSM